ncbi:hypothetical protein EX30DRAFT_161770 [Ascodesmis nigricans]|uniref:Uncharacterized protein n=1 Tax=Ascodesmis nigricans TaxID=341454 RepID=A0A4V3SI05_9PEZI|nr:hypothetical protein EX30DRAFT_161770 [Ascodesmis nigricans]
MSWPSSSPSAPSSHPRTVVSPVLRRRRRRRRRRSSHPPASVARHTHGCKADMRWASFSSVSHCSICPQLGRAPVKLPQDHSSSSSAVSKSLCRIPRHYKQRCNKQSPSLHPSIYPSRTTTSDPCFLWTFMLTHPSSVPSRH